MPPVQWHASRTFHGLPQVAANDGGPEGLHLGRGNKSGYMEVEILNPQKERPMYVTDKVQRGACVWVQRNVCVGVEKCVYVYVWVCNRVSVCVCEHGLSPASQFQQVALFTNHLLPVKGGDGVLKWNGVYRWRVGLMRRPPPPLLLSVECQSQCKGEKVRE
jgi:hypothetical protein